MAMLSPATPHHTVIPSSEEAIYKVCPSLRAKLHHDVCVGSAMHVGSGPCFDFSSLSPRREEARGCRFQPERQTA